MYPRASPLPYARTTENAPLMAEKSLATPFRVMFRKQRLLGKMQSASIEVRWPPERIASLHDVRTMRVPMSGRTKHNSARARDHLRIHFFKEGLAYLYWQRYCYRCLAASTHELDRRLLSESRDRNMWGSEIA
jgi:hypothetical protein